MAAARGRDTKPELAVRRIVHGLGGRFSLKRSRLPGTPDLVLPARNLAIFVHGCFWHAHDCPRGARQPATNRDYWVPKLARNVERDAEALAACRRLGWRAAVVWACELKDLGRLTRRLARLLRARPNPRRSRPR